MDLDLLKGYFSFFSTAKQADTTNHALMQKCYDEGFQASSEGLKHTENPYAEGSEEARAWSRGFWVW
ncbi:hypothetical protein [Methylophilus sp. 14]|uniref:hypothetical protein n=1 Tax=Methylophilus sp. 14 TaxID=2781019 RepID=UPI00188FEB78|nr:hypothetical protein [Methylophilus sp. 14]MBF4988733.1 hypothetical protein [Methylophilus sp. 14]